MIYRYIEEKAESLLKAHNSYKMGFDIFLLAKEMNVYIIEKDLENDVSGLFVMSGNKPIISYNKTDGNERKRFTIAHELGHFVLHSKEKPLFIDSSPKVMFRNSASSSGEIHQEKEANAFAAALLMPKKLIDDAVGNFIGKGELIKFLAKKFKVSEQAMTFRLANLGYDFGIC